MLACVAAAVIEMMAHAAQPEVAFDPRVRAELWILFHDARYGHTNMEQAAFIIRDRDGRLTLMRWPRAAEPREGRWRGPFPAGTIAIAHTHPNRSPKPSFIDERTARSRGVPVYVVTRLRITKTNGAKSLTVAEGDWFH